jgi:hypothetical protein
MMPAKTVAQGRLDCGNVHRAAAEQFPDASGTHSGLGEQPTVPLLLIDQDQLFRDPVYITGADFNQSQGDRSVQGGIGGPACQLLDAAGQESAVTDPVSTHQGDGRHPALRQHPGVLHRSRRGTDLVRNEPMFENMQQRCDILLDAGVEELFDDLIAAELRDVLGQQCPDFGAKFRQMSSDRRRDCGQLGSDSGVPALHSKIIALPRTPVHTDQTARDCLGCLGGSGTPHLGRPSRSRRSGAGWPTNQAGWGTPDQLASRLDLPNIVKTLHLSMVASVEIAYVVRDTAADHPGLTAPARIIGMRSQGEAEIAIEQGETRYEGVTWATRRQRASNQLIPLPEPARRGLINLADDVVATTNQAVAAGAHLDPSDVTRSNRSGQRAHLGRSVESHQITHPHDPARRGPRR